LEYCYDVWYRETRMVWLPDGKKISKISLFVLTECINMTDGRTDTAWAKAVLDASIARQK